MKTLALESSTSKASIALVQDAQTLVQTRYEAGRGSNPTPLYEALQKIKTDGPIPDRILIGIGPGSYSGTRIAISVGIGLAAAWKIPLHGITSFLGFPIEENAYHVLGDARREAYYHAKIEGEKMSASPAIVPAGEIDALLQDGLPVVSADKLSGISKTIQSWPDATRLCLAAEKNRGSVIDGSNGLEPLYLRPPHITRARKSDGYPGVT